MNEPLPLGCTVVEDKDRHGITIYRAYCRDRLIGAFYEKTIARYACRKDAADQEKKPARVG